MTAHSLRKWYDGWMSVKILGLIVGFVCLITGYSLLSETQAINVTTEPTLVGTTYYGGNWDESKKAWIIDNKDQCDRVRAGEFSAQSLSGEISPTCSDDNGEGFVEGTKLHNRVSFAELSTDPSAKDFSALGDLPLGAKIEISYRGKCLVAEKLDVGQGGGPVNGYQRSLDLWWQTARSLDFKNGFDVMSIRRVPDNSPLTELGKSYPCIQNTTSLEQGQSTPTEPNSPQTTVNNSSSDSTPNVTDNSRKNTLLGVLAVGMILFSVLALLGFLRHIKK